MDMLSFMNTWSFWISVVAGAVGNLLFRWIIKKVRERKSKRIGKFPIRQDVSASEYTAWGVGINYPPLLINDLANVQGTSEQPGPSLGQSFQALRREEMLKIRRESAGKMIDVAITNAEKENRQQEEGIEKTLKKTDFKFIDIQ